MTDTGSEVSELGLRERKKQRTRETIVRVAIELFTANGFHETTIRQIADAADVSPRTVSAYFPAKEELVFSDSEEAFDSLSTHLANRPSGVTVADGLRDWIRNLLLEGDMAEIQRRQCTRELIETDPVLRSYERGIQERAEQIIAGAVAVDLELQPDDLLPRMVAAATMAALDALSGDAKHVGDKLPADILAPLDDAMAFVGGGVTALAARRGLAR